jgi:hypothetical protein
MESFMKRFFSSILIAVILLMWNAGCDKNPAGSEYQKELTVFGYLWGGERLTADHAVWIAYTKPITAYYEADQAALRNGDVTIREQDTGAVYRLREQSGRPGFYFNDSLLVRPKAAYLLSVVAEGKTLTAATTVPPQLEMTTTLRTDTVNVVKPEKLSRVMPIFLQCENPEQVVLVDVNCNEPYQNAEYIHPFHESMKHPQNQEEYDGGANGEPKHITAFARYREFVSPDYPGQIVIFWYSSMLVFYGSYTMQVVAIDDNFHNYLYNEHPETKGGIQGGIGVFGSMCGKVFKLRVVK